MALPYGDGKPALEAIYGFEKQAKDERAQVIAKVEQSSPQRQLTHRFEYKVPTRLRHKPHREIGQQIPAANEVQQRPFTADDLYKRKGEQFHGVKQLNQAAHGARARLCMDWSDVRVHKRRQPKEAEPWKKAGYDHPNVVKAANGGWMCRSKEPWPTHGGGGYRGVVKEWHGGPLGKERVDGDRVAMGGRVAYGRGWELRVGDSIGREAFVRCVPARERHPPQAPWHKPGNDYGPWNQPEYKGRRGPRTHQVLQHRFS